MPGEDTILEEMGREHRLGRCVGLITTLLCLWHHGAVLGSSPPHLQGSPWMWSSNAAAPQASLAVLLHCTECKHPILQRSELPCAGTHRACPALPQAPNPLGQTWRSQYRALHSQAMV